VNCEYRDTILKASNVSLTLGKNVILRDLNLEIRDLYRPGYITGQIVGVLGPSGIGKTRLFRILSGIDRPDTGEVLIGQKCEDAPKGFNFATKTLDVFLFLQHHRIGILHGVPPENDGDGIVFYPQKSGLAIVNYRLAREMPRE